MQLLMKRIFAILVTMLLIVPLSVDSVHGEEVDFKIRAQQIYVEIKADGSGTFEESVLYDIKFMNGALHQIDYKGHDFVDYQVAVIEEGSTEKNYLTEESNGLPGTYEVNKQDGLMSFKVYYPVQNKKVFFVYEYTLLDLVTNYLDTAELNRKVVGEHTDFYMDVQAEIMLPGLVEDMDAFRVWGHGSPDGNVERIERDGKSGIRLTVLNNPRNQFVEVHSVFPLSLTPKNTNIVEEEGFQRIVAEEEARIEADQQAYRRFQRKNLLISIGITLLSLLAAVGGFFYYVKTRKKLNPHPIKLPKHIYELPEDVTPAIMASAVLRAEPIPLDFTATIVDLARKGYLTIEEKESAPGTSFFNRKGISTIILHPIDTHPPIENLLQHERYVLEYIFPTQKSITLKELEKSNKKKSSGGRRRIKLWEKFSNYASARGAMLYPKADSERYRSFFFAIFSSAGSFVVLVVNLILIDLSREQGVFEWYDKVLIVVPIASLIIGILNFLFATIRPIKTAKEDEGTQMWKGFKNMLNDIGKFNMREIGSLELWEEYLVYAISLGVADKVAKEMHMQFPQEELQQMQISPTYYRNPYLFTHALNESMTRSLSPAMSSGSNTGGFGGGFSGGSSGGSGGGSGSGGF